MSKKLLMNNYSENGLMPVMDGLICWLDGRDGSGQDTVWKDRSGNGNDFELNGFTFSGEDGWTGKNLKVNFGQYAILENMLLTENHTIEIDLFIDGVIDNEQTRFFYFGNNNPSNRIEYTFRKTNNGINNPFHIKHGKSFYNMYTTKLKRYNIFMKGTLSSFLINIDNKLLVEKGNTFNLMSSIVGNFILGGSENLNNFCKARFNSIKIYNKVLTEEEIKQNYLYEQSIERG